MSRSRLLFPLFSVLALAACADDSETGDSNSAVDTGAGAVDVGGAADAGEQADAAPVAERCIYPDHRDRLGFGEVIPDYSWGAAYLGDQPVDEGFDLYEFHCSEEFDAYDTLVVVVTTVWCPYCPGMINYVDALSERLEQEGALVLFVEAQNRSGGPIDTEGAQDHISESTPNNSGYRVGDADNFEPNAMATNRFLSAFPTTFVIRREDMVLVTDSSRSNYYLPFVEIAMNPTADWSAPGPPKILPSFSSNCGPEDEEPGEGPNNRPDGGTVVDSSGIEVLGGICDPNPDYYNVTIEGPWRATLSFLHSEGDLDMYVWDVAESRPVSDAEGNNVGSYGTDNTETFDFAGPASLVIVGYENATASYSLTIEAL